MIKSNLSIKYIKTYTHISYKDRRLINRLHPSLIFREIQMKICILI